MTESSAEINGRRRVNLPPLASGHDLVGNLDDGLLYCQRCPLVAYDLADAATEPICPMPLQG